MESLSRRGLNRAGIEAKAGQGWVWVKAAWGGQQAVRSLIIIYFKTNREMLILNVVNSGRPIGEGEIL